MKPTHPARLDFIHIATTKFNIIISSYLRVLRICNTQYLHDEKYIENAFKLLQCSNNFVINVKWLAYKIHENKKKTTQITFIELVT